MMTRAEKTFFFDRLIPDGLHNPLYTTGTGGVELHFRCPIRDHEHDSDRKTGFAVNLHMLVWHCFKCGRGGTPFQLAQELLGSRDAARQMFKVVNRRMGDGTMKLKFGKRDRYIEQRREAVADPPRIETGDVAIFLRSRPAESRGCSRQTSTALPVTPNNGRDSGSHEGSPGVDSRLISRSSISRGYGPLQARGDRGTEIGVSIPCRYYLPWGLSCFLW